MLSRRSPPAAGRPAEPWQAKEGFYPRGRKSRRFKPCCPGGTGHFNACTFYAPPRRTARKARGQVAQPLLAVRPVHHDASGNSKGRRDAGATKAASLPSSGQASSGPGSRLVGTTGVQKPDRPHSKGGKSAQGIRRLQGKRPDKSHPSAFDAEYRLCY
jgi:hypothetical protein